MGLQKSQIFPQIFCLQVGILLFTGIVLKFPMDVLIVNRLPCNIKAASFNSVYSCAGEKKSDKVLKFVEILTEHPMLIKNAQSHMLLKTII